MTKITTSLLVLLGFTVPSLAATVQLNKGLSPGFMVLTDAGAAVTTGKIWIGTFALGAAPAAQADGSYDATDFTALLDSFKVFGSAALPAAANTAITGSITAAPGVPADFNTLRMFAIVTNTVDPRAATQFALISNTPATAFPADSTAAVSVNFNVNTFANVAVIAGAGSTTDNATGAESLRLVAIVPEPSSFTLAGLAVLGLIGKRRR